ncbi:Non-reducing end beta-L-arabinofuranosidase [mine drainage metagenome]|uniref:Non-reducing end beta-L-arabinofuranosidase n=1 Tax=mine drainage metagenome TaxID=410659 RepID=A0A1J5R285_9ZZZZ
MKPLFSALVGLAALATSLPCRASDTRMSPRPPDYAVFRELPLTAVRPEGWLREYLVHQRNGLTGHLEAAGYPFNTVGWAAPRIPDNTSIEAWWPYEQNAYWIDGMIRCGILLRDKFLETKARHSLDYVLNHPAPNGYLGPLLDKDTGAIGRWPQAVFFRALMADYDGTRNPAIPLAMERDFLAGDHAYTSFRDVVNVEGMLWTYGKTGNPALLHLARKVYNDYNARNPGADTSAEEFMKDAPATGEHGVTYNEIGKLGAILYMYTGDSSALRASESAFRKLDKYHMLVSGVNVSSERLEPVTTTESAETCDISDHAWSLGYLLMATGNARYADEIERDIFNAAPGGVTSDFKALQYYTAPNQVICTHASSPRTGGSQMSFSPNPGTECCPGNVNRIMPNFASRLWMASRDGGVAAVMYAPCRLVYELGAKRQRCEFNENTHYPFDGEIRLEFSTRGDPVRFPLSLRIPGWAHNASITVNGTVLHTAAAPDTFVEIDRTFQNGDVITLRFPQHLALEDGPDHTVSVIRGPLVYSLKIAEDWRRDAGDKRSTPDFPAYDVYPASSWNYALCVDPSHLADEIEVVNHGYNESPWAEDSAPLELRVPARLVRGWKIIEQDKVEAEHWDVIRDPATHKVINWVKHGVDVMKGDFKFTPPVPTPEYLLSHLDTKVETVTLIPYGCAKLRVTYFPVCPR